MALFASIIASAIFQHKLLHAKTLPDKLSISNAIYELYDIIDSSESSMIDVLINFLLYYISMRFIELQFAIFSMDDLSCTSDIDEQRGGVRVWVKRGGVRGGMALVHATVCQCSSRHGQSRGLGRRRS